MKWISRLTHPVLTFPLVLILLFASDDEWVDLGVTLLLSFGLPFLYFLWLWANKKVKDFDISDRKQRYPVYAASLTGMFLALIYLFLMGSEAIFFEYLRLLALAVTIVFVNLKIKVSIHTAMIFLLSLFLVEYYAVSLLIFLLVPVVAFSRVQLKKHEPLEVILGVLIPSLFYLQRLVELLSASH